MPVTLDADSGLALNEGQGPQLSDLRPKWWGFKYDTQIWEHPSWDATIWNMFQKPIQVYHMFSNFTARQKYVETKRSQRVFLCPGARQLQASAD